MSIPDKKISLVFFSDLASDPNSLKFTYFFNSITEFFDKEGALMNVFCLYYDGSLTVDSTKVYAFNKTFQSKLIALKRKLGWAQDRQIVENKFDDFALKHLLKNPPDLVLMAKGVNIKLLFTLNKKNIRSIYISAICHPEYIFNEISKASTLIGKNEYASSVYTNKVRRNKIVEMLNFSSYVIPMMPSKFVKKTYELHGVPSDKILNLERPWGVSNNTITYKERKFNNKLTFLAVNAKTLKKGTYFLIQAWQEFITKGGDAQLIIAGGETKSDFLEFSNLKNIEFVGKVNDVNSLYHSADIFIGSSIIDLGTRTVMEAMSTGMPAIVSSQMGISEFIEKDSGCFIYGPYDTEQLAGIIMQLHNTHQNLLSEYSRMSYRTSLTFNQKTYNKNLLDTILKFT